jgi:hypothetical protein
MTIHDILKEFREAKGQTEKWGISLKDSLPFF